MPRRKPAAKAASRTAADYRLTTEDLDEDLDELLLQAQVPKDKRADCAVKVNYEIDFYRERIARMNAPSEASQAESFALVRDAAKELAKALADLPLGLRAAVEPDYPSSIRRWAGEQNASRDRGVADQQAPDDKELLSISSTQYDAATECATSTDPYDLMDYEALSPITEFAELHAPRKRTDLDDLLLRAMAPLPLERMLAALIETANDCCTRVDKRVSRAASKQRRTLIRDELARELKAIVINYSLNLSGDERAAEDWTARALEWAGISYPKRETNLVDRL